MIAIISDSHDNFANLEEFLKQIKAEGINKILHCGDVTTPEFLNWLAENFPGQIKLAFGNMEIRANEFKDVATENPNLEIFSEIGELVEKTVTGQETRIAFAHKPEKANELAVTDKYDFIFYGHTHKPWLIEKENGVILANPGTLGGVFSEPTYAIFDPKTRELRLRKLYS